MGLAWTSHGGSTLYIETLNEVRKKKFNDAGNEVPGNGGIEFTGDLDKYFNAPVLIKSICFTVTLQLENDLLLSRSAFLGR